MSQSEEYGTSPPRTEPEATSEAAGSDRRAAYVEASPDGVVAVDADGTIRYANLAARSMLRGTHGRTVGERFGFPIGWGTVEVGLRQPGGEMRMVEMRVTPIRLDGEERWVVSLRDTTRSHEENRRLTDELQGIDNALAVTSHELRNPLSVLAGSVEMLIENWDDLEEEQKLYQLRRIQRNTVRMGYTVDSVLDAARISSGTFHPVLSRVNLLTLFLERINDLGDGGNGIGIDVAPDLDVNAHPDHVWMVVSNFLVNSLKYGDPPRSLTAQTDGQRVTIAVTDSGNGVPAEFVPTLFDRYIRGPLQDQSGGTGLGLWIARSIAEAYGGGVRYEAAEPGGARFCFELDQAPRVQVPR